MTVDGVSYVRIYHDDTDTEIAKKGLDAAIERLFKSDVGIAQRRPYRGPSRRALAWPAAMDHSGFMLTNWEVCPRHGTLLSRDPPDIGAGADRTRHGRVDLPGSPRRGGRHPRRIQRRSVGRPRGFRRGPVPLHLAAAACLVDDSREPRFIRTIARIGYTLVPIPAPLAPGCTEVTEMLP